VTYTEIHNAIRSRFKTQIEDGESLTTLYCNDGQAAPADNSMWCRFYILDSPGKRLTVGVKNYRRPGVAVAQLFGPLGQGDGALIEMADAIATAFTSVSADGVRYLTAYQQPVGLEGGQYQINVICPFEAEHQA
jgi:hypothetical protein